MIRNGSWRSRSIRATTRRSRPERRSVARIDPRERRGKSGKRFLAATLTLGFAGAQPRLHPAPSRRARRVELQLHYRKDIDGLRAIAVLLVILFHVHPHRVTGGFIGVDVFFVISGFLITGLICSGLRDGSFSLLDFYARRVRRIFPALAVVLAA